MKNSKIKWIAPAILLALGASAWALPTFVFHRSPVAVAVPSAVPASAAIEGDYVEARTAAVFAGACHYNGELVTTGRDALMAWNFTSGTTHGVNIAGVRVVAAVTSNENLSDTSAAHRSEIVVDSNATSEQAKAVVDLLKTTCGDSLGTVVRVRQAAVTFSHAKSVYSVTAADFGTLSIEYLPDDSCCTQAGDVWYSPLSPIEHRKVGYTETASFAGGVAAPWYRSAENSAFYGRFSF